MAIVYKITRIETGQCYVGHSVMPKGDRWKAHRYHLNKGDHHAPYLQRAWTKYGPAAFSFEIIEECDDEDKIVREQYYTDILDSCFNTRPAAGSNFGHKFSEHARANMRVAQQNNLLVGQHRVGFKEDPDASAKRLALAKTGIANSPTVWITNGTETRKHPIEAPIPDGFQKGRTFSTTHRASVVARNTQSKSDEAKANMRAARLKFLADNPDRHEEIVAAKRTWEWYTDGTHQQQVAEGETPPAGWWLGMAIKRGGVKWVTNGTEGRRIPDGEPPPEGWWFGFPPTRRHPNRVVAPTQTDLKLAGD